MGSNNRYDVCMPQPGQTVSDNCGDWIILQLLSSGRASDVYLVRKAVDKEQKFVMKCEKELKGNQSALAMDLAILAACQKSKGFARLKGCGQTDYYKFVVMEQLGPSLETVRQTLPEKKFSLGTIFNILRQTLKRLETLHEFGFVYRDVKLSNFAIGLGKRDDTIYLWDFGTARTYREADGRIRPARTKAPFRGTPLYAALASHKNQELYRQHDLESWLYMAMEMFKGPLPWANFTEPADIPEYKKDIRLSLRTAFFRDLPAEFDLMMTILDGYANADRPDYAHFRKLLSLAAESMSANVEEDFDWQQKPKVVEKNTPVAKEKSADGENENAKASSEKMSKEVLSAEKMSKEVLNKDKEKTTSREEQKNEDSQGDSDARAQDPFSS